MRILYLSLFLCVLLNGCATAPAPFTRVFSPAQADYDRADAYFKSGDYPQAIAAYEKFIKNYPRSSLLPGAYLGLGWTHYLRGEYKKTLDTLAKVRTQDTGLKTWIDKLTRDSQKRITTTTADTGPTIFNIPAFTNKERLIIEGKIPDGAAATINGVETTSINGVLKHEITLADGKNTLTIALTDKEGKTEETTTTVILDRTPLKITVTDAVLDDFGYVELTGTTKKGAEITAEGELLMVDAQGIFSGRINCPRNKQIALEGKDQAGNTAQEIFADNDYPDEPSGLRVASLRGTSADVEWDENREKDLKGYNVYVTLPGEYTDRKDNQETITQNIYTLNNLRSGNTYAVYLRAIDKMDNESDKSSSQSIVVP